MLTQDKAILIFTIVTILLVIVFELIISEQIHLDIDVRPTDNIDYQVNEELMKKLSNSIR